MAFKLGPNTGPKMGSNTEPKLNPNNGPKLSQNSGPKLTLSNEPKLQLNIVPGIYGVPIGPGIHGTKQKLSTPCSWFKNTMNIERISNTEKIVNLEYVMNLEKQFEFKSSDDILKLLKTHPDFERIPIDCLQPIVAAILSGN